MMQRFNINVRMNSLVFIGNVYYDCILQNQLKTSNKINV